MQEKPSGKETKPLRQRFAVIDLGTNTFHLLIAEAGENGAPLKEIYRVRRFIKLAESGITTLSTAALERGMEALILFRQQIEHYTVPGEQVIALGTAALRTATNGPSFTAKIKALTNINIQIISGDREAQLIAKGALLAIPTPTEKVLIMDIGGGSVEFIIADQTRVYWAQSFPVGVAVLRRQFQHSDPIVTEEITTVQQFLEQQLSPLQEALQQYKSCHLVGAAGTFDVVADHLRTDNNSPQFAPIALDQFDAFYREVLNSTQQEIYDMPGIPNDRADMIVVALILIDLILKVGNIEKLTVSFYAMKEGMLSELLGISRSEG